ncbi:23284_t:CDS:10 [Racocetra persica]|uniref:23284_t:CDS:1 n=1 Tax=Racocetra persica TaxID=160502 RepID=A0ACA9L6E7_9GLOM|nr:23284_t:CDS:10 [Racocetra persica]
MAGFKILLTVSIILSIVNANRTVFINPNDPWQAFEGWGTSLCWWANVLGGVPDVRNYSADLVFDLNKGLGLNVIRYNIGGGENPLHHHMRLGNDVPGFLPCEACDYNWTSDANQRWILFAARERGANIFEAFSNSPPYWMTISNCSSGGYQSANNLNPNYFDAFAKYLTDVVKWYSIQGLTFRTLEPFNEPSGDHFWQEYGRQEGCSYSCAEMNIIIKKVGVYLKDKGLSNKTSISAVDENIFDQEVSTIECIDNNAKSYVSQYNTHAYGGNQRPELLNISKQDGKKLWMSEVGLMVSREPSDMSTSIILSEKILNDMRNLKPAAWIYWQAIEDMEYAYDWGLIGVNFSNSTSPLNIRLAFYGFAQYTKFIRPGYQIIYSNDNDTLSAYHASNQTLVIVCTNKNNISEVWSLDVSMFNVGSFTAFRTSSNNETLTKLPNTWNITNSTLTYLSPANSITTWVFSSTIPKNNSADGMKAYL